MGIVVFDLIEGSNIDDYQSRQDDSANKLEARLKPHRETCETQGSPHSNLHDFIRARCKQDW